MSPHFLGFMGRGSPASGLTFFQSSGNLCYPAHWQNSTSTLPLGSQVAWAKVLLWTAASTPHPWSPAPLAMPLLGSKKIEPNPRIVQNVNKSQISHAQGLRLVELSDGFRKACRLEAEVEDKGDNRKRPTPDYQFQNSLLWCPLNLLATSLVFITIF